MLSLELAKVNITESLDTLFKPNIKLNTKYNTRNFMTPSLNKSRISPYTLCITGALCFTGILYYFRDHIKTAIKNIKKPPK